MSVGRAGPLRHDVPTSATHCVADSLVAWTSEADDPDKNRAEDPHPVDVRVGDRVRLRMSAVTPTSLMPSLAVAAEALDSPGVNVSAG